MNQNYLQVLIFSACDRIHDAKECVTAETGFDCKWCDITMTCADGLDRYTSDWNTSGCLDEVRFYT